MKNKWASIKTLETWSNKIKLQKFDLKVEGFFIDW